MAAGGQPFRGPAAGNGGIVMRAPGANTYEQWSEPVDGSWWHESQARCPEGGLGRTRGPGLVQAARPSGP